MTLHDESMARHGELKRIKKQLKKMDDPGDHSDLKALVEKADEDMWDWMHTWEKPVPELSKEDKLQHYMEWHQKMEIVDEQIVKAIEMAKSQLQ